MPEPRPAPVLTLHRPPSPATSIEERDDEALMVLAARDHRRAFEVLAGRHLRPLTSYCAKFLGSARAGEEVAQDALVAVWERRLRYRPSRFRVFLFTIARNRCLNRLRDERRRLAWNGPQIEDEPHDAKGDRPDQLDALLERERQRRTREALMDLAPKLREAVLLRFDQGLDYAEIARVVGRPEVTVRSRVFHALKRLRAALAEGEDR
jgi:RNA polymerase sigma-70 factor (ECF subfamily)